MAVTVVVERRPAAATRSRFESIAAFERAKSPASMPEAERLAAAAGSASGAAGGGWRRRRRSVTGS